MLIKELDQICQIFYKTLFISSTELFGLNQICLPLLFYQVICFFANLLVFLFICSTASTLLTLPSK